jgi:hypothetical protein
MYRNLNAEMARNGYTVANVQAILKKCDRTTRSKLNGETPISIQEAIVIRDTMFPQLSIDYLFTTKEV